MLTRTVNYSFATTMFGAQNAVEAELDKKRRQELRPAERQQDDVLY